MRGPESVGANAGGQGWGQQGGQQGGRQQGLGTFTERLRRFMLGFLCDLEAKSSAKGPP